MGKRILVTGTGRSGSWKIRGEQLGEAIGADVLPRVGYEDCSAAELIVIVKRAPPETLDLVRRSGRPWVWDVVDAWPQRPGHPLAEREARRWLKNSLLQLQPSAVVWPTQRMQADARWSGPQLVLPHHAWPRYTTQPLNDQIRVVGYEGAAHYLGRWRAVLEQECALRGWRFEANGDLQQADIGVALRDGGGYAAAHWKSNCKLANLQALGIPALCSPESGYQESACGSEVWIQSAGGIAAAFDQLDPVTERHRLRGATHGARVDLASIAAAYREWLDGL